MAAPLWHFTDRKPGARRTRRLLVSGYIYHSPEVFALEKERIFMKDWLCVAREEELRNAGDYMAFHVAREPAVLVRNKAGELRALLNICAHRGAQVASGAGNVMRFSCPYHGWSYDLDGRMTGAAFMKDVQGFAKENCRLPPLRVAVWQGWVFVNFDDAAPPLEDFVSELDQEYGFLRQDNCRLAAKFELEFDCNWKLLVERLIAQGLSGRRQHADARRRGGISAAHTSGTLTPDGQTLFRKMDALAGKPENFAALAHLSPNLCMLARADHVHHLVSWPTAPGKTKLVAYILFPEAFHSEPGFAAKAETYSSFLRRRLLESAPLAGQSETYVRLDKALGSSFQHYLGRVFA